MNREIDTTILSLSEKMKTLTNAHVEEYKKSINMMLFREDNNLKERSEFFWNEIDENSYYFDRKFLLKDQLLNITADDVKKAFEDIFFNKPNKLSIQVRLI